MKDNKIWIISEYYYPIITSTGYYITEIAEYIASKQGGVHVICTNAKYNERKTIKSQKYEVWNGVHIHRIPTGNINKNVFLLRALRLFVSSWRLFFKIFVQVKKTDQVLVVTNPAFLILFMPVIRFFKGVEYQILVHDIFPENLSAIGKIDKNSVLYRFIKRIYDYSYAKALRCIAIGRDMKSVLAKKINNKTEIIVIPNWADVDDVFPLEKENTNLMKKLDLKGKFIFQFAGNIGMAQGLENLMNAIELVNNENIHFLFIGSGAYEPNVRNFIEKNKLHNVTLIGFQDRSTQNDFLNACDVGIVTLNDQMYGLGIPSKSYNIMASGKPILMIGDAMSEISLCVSEFNIGWVVEPGNPQKLSELFENIYLDYAAKGQFDVCDSRSIAVDYFSKKYILNKYYELFQ